MSQKPESGQNRWIVLMVLMMGVGVLLLVFVLQTKDDEVKPLDSAAPLSAEATRLPVRKLSSDEILKWITDKMKQSNAKVGVVNVWATWCEPCRDEMPELAKYQKLGQAPLFLISADNDVDEPLVRTFLHEKGVEFASRLIKGDQQKFVETWQKLSSDDPARRWSMSLPATFLINASGQIISFNVGTTTAKALEILVKKNLGSTP
jgi:thiol-disulfide isomerase/thioredoxin